MQNTIGEIAKRKSQHIEIVLNKDVEPNYSDLEQVKLKYKALPEIDMSTINSRVTFFGKQLSFPMLISSMTGGPDLASEINVRLAQAAEEAKVALGLGSMRVALKHPELLSSFQVRKYCPSIPLFANFGLVQLNYGYNVDDLNHLIDSIEADGIFLHINALQEAVQPEGDTNFSGLLTKLENLIPKLHVPVIIKEVGNGIDRETAVKLRETGVEWLDVAGLGGTSWPMVEGYRREDFSDEYNLGELFAGEGLSTVESLEELNGIEGIRLIASGGLRSGLDIAKSIALGAEVGGIAKPLLSPALESADKVVEYLKRYEREFRIAMFMNGATKVGEIQLSEAETSCCGGCGK